MSKSEDSIRSSNSIINKKVRTFDIYSADMKDVRIIQNNLVYVIGLSSTLANKEVKRI